MKKLNKFIFAFLVCITFLFICSTVSSAATLNIRNKLKNGSKGEQVEILQTQLNSVMNAGLKPDGIFGTKTRKAVIEFQKKYGLVADGIAGISTCSKLNVEYLSDNNYVAIYVEPSVNKGELNVRAKANATATKLGTIPSGTSVIYYGTTVTNGTTWYKIKYNGKDAYICGSYAYKTCVLLDLSDQILKFYKDGKLELEAPVITGNKNKTTSMNPHPTPTGKYLFKYVVDGIVCRKTPAVLKGYNDDGSQYKREVSYWMNFIPYRGIGFHDAWWRSSSQFYNVNTYLTSGSHGCVNMRTEDAKALYELLPDKTNVLIVE